MPREDVRPSARPLIAATTAKRDHLWARCTGWAVLTGAAAGGTLMLGAELSSLAGDGSFELPFVVLGLVFGALLALPVGAVIAAAVLRPLRTALAGGDPSSEVRKLLAAIVLGLNAPVVLIVAATASDLSRWWVFVAGLAVTDLAAGLVLAAAHGDLVRHGAKRRATIGAE